jgi:RNA polymerase sigma factor (sigma-70 family)
MELTKQERFMQLYAPVHDRFERYCKTRSCGEFHFKDIMHDTLIVAFEKFDTLKSQEAFPYFLFGTATRILSNYRKKMRPIYTDNFNRNDLQLSTAETPVELQNEIQHLYQQLDKLDPETRDCIILFEISGFSIKEIMTIQNAGESAVKQRLSRGRKQLMALMNSLETKLA